MNLTFVIALWFLLFSASDFAAERVPWTTSHLQGSPEKPANYRVARLFPNQKFTNCLDIVFNRSLGRWFVAEQSGKIFSFDVQGEGRNLVADFGPLQGPEGSVYGFTFDPDFVANRFIYVCYALKSELPEGTHVSRFKMTGEVAPRIEMVTEELLITWLSGGHNGGCLKFGPDGDLYISAGDGGGPNPPDPLHTGQDVSDLLSSLLRIDVRQGGEGRKYSVPKDNPFVGRPNTRPEVWAFGFRNPWRFGIDQTNGEIWVGDVGWELWELIYRVERGGNYGWSIVEGRQPVHATDPRGPGVISPPIKDHPHSEAASITGGFVYHGQKFPALNDAFLYGDWETGKIWGLRANKEKVTYSEELTDTTLRVVSFAEDAQGETVILDYNGGLYSLEANSVATQQGEFPKKLSETGLFSSVADHVVAPGVTKFEVIAPIWNDFATAERFVALPDLTSITNAERPWRYPSNAVFVRTVSLEMEQGRAESRKRIETQVLHFNGDGWGAYSYRWNEEQTDGVLVPPEGAETMLKIVDQSQAGGIRMQPWRYHARAECLRCHNPWCGTALGFTPEQLSRVARERFEAGKFFASALSNSPPSLVSPFDESQNLGHRARSYLHVNCSHCHRENAGGAVPAVMNIDLADDKLHMLEARPTRGDLGLTHARVIAPGAPFSSVALFRTSATGRSRMPYLGTRLVDEAGVSLLREWIETLPSGVSRNAGDEMEQLRAALTPSSANLDRLAAPALLSTTEALRLAHATAQPTVSPDRREALARAVMKSPNPLVRELFERFLPAEARTYVSQSIAPKQEILARSGDPKRGGALLLDSTRLSCLQCHQYQGAGKDFGPPFWKAVQNKARADILENIIEPSRQIAPEYLLYTAELADDESISGMIVSRTEQEVVLRDAASIEHKIPMEKVKSLRAQQLSAMPEGLLAGLTAQEVADLLEALMAAVK